MMAMMLGSNTIVDGADVVGLAFQGSLACDEAEPSVALLERTLAALRAWEPYALV